MYSAFCIQYCFGEQVSFVASDAGVGGSHKNLHGDQHLDGSSDWIELPRKVSVPRSIHHGYSYA